MFFEVTPRGVGESASKSLQYWNIGNGDDTMVTVWNPADEAQDFIFTLFFSGGHYALPLRLEPRATRMFNISEIIHNQVPDAEGNVIPVSVQEGSAKISGSRAENESILVAIDAGTFNVRKATCSPTCMWCYGNVQTKVVDNPFTTTVNGTKQLSFISTWGSGAQYNLTNSASWTTGNAPVATVQTGLVTGVAPGTVTISASASNQPIQVYICSMTAVVCPVVLLQGGDPGTVKPTLTIQGNNYVYIGHDAQVTQHTNAQFGSGTPSGGTYSWSSPDSSISFDNSSAATTHITATNYSGGTNDTSIVLNYSLNGTPATPVTVMVTKRLFYYLAGDLMTLSAAYNGPSVYGYTYSRSYNVFTHPDGGQVTGGNGVGTYENVTQTSSNASVSPNFGQGSLDANSKVQDTLGLISSAPLPVGLRIVDTQDIGVGGFFVRNNVVTFTETGITVNSNGPSN